MLLLFTKLKRVTLALLPLIYALIGGGLLILLARANPFITYWRFLNAGFSCASGAGRCAFLITLTFATPLIFAGLSATVALRAGFFSIGQMGQMMVGAAAAAWIGSRVHLPAGIHPAAALLASLIFGGLWGLVPALLKEYVGVNEIISTLMLNPIAGLVIRLFPMGRLVNTALLLPLVPSTKLTAGIFIALGCVVGVLVHIWYTTRGLEIRTTAQAPRFARYAGISPHFPVLRAMLISGALAGLAGGVEVLGVQYHFVSSFTTFTDFDGLIVAFVGHLNPFGVVLAGILLGGLRSGAITGLQIASHIPNELGGAIIALILLFVSTNRLSRSFSGTITRKRFNPGLNSSPDDHE
jgi:ABC-type uncharacterized transport system permease subunit